MLIENLIEGRLFIAENDKEVELMQRFSAALADYDLNSTPSYKRRKLQRMWIQIEYLTKTTLPMSMGIKRSDVFECNEDD